MKKLSGYEIRKMWLDFFQSKGHSVEKSSSLIPNNDPTLLWINAGVSPLKSYFDGSLIPKNPRIVNAQKCIRTNDIENVGVTARHQTFFEMLGNFSIGDYFRDDAIAWGYELLTSDEWFGFDPNLLYMTVYPTDEDTYNKWLSVGVKEDHIIKTNYNFWEIGEGPCGPCTEIFYDRGIGFGEGDISMIRDDIENDRYIEIWNIVFSQYNAKKGLERSEYPELPSKNIDTGMGLDRMACVIQNTKTNFETDFFMPIINKIEEISNVKYDGQMAFKVISDHIRCVTFAISDGAMLSNEGRGYVLRRLLRRAVKHGKSLGINQAFIYSLVDVVIDVMKNHYPYLIDKRDIVVKIVKKEEEKFLETLVSGEKKINDLISQSNEKVLSGKDAFLLYDTYGFPIELTIEYLEEHGVLCDIDGFHIEMEKQKERARKARKAVGSMKAQNEEYIAFKENSEFVGYQKDSVLAKVVRVFAEGIVLDKTPFYAESGGQVADIGTIKNDNFNANVIDVQKLPNGQFIHQLEISFGEVQDGDLVQVSIDKQRRFATMKNHSATHLLFKVLRDELGDHVSQQGSQVTSHNFRFDFNNYDPITEDTLLAIEQKVNDIISKKNVVNVLEMSIDEAKKMGAIAEFGEKYGDVVRVVDMGETVDLCGGTHVDNVADIEKIAIASIESKGSGIYRIEGLSSNNISLIKDKLTGFNNEITKILNKAQHIVKEAKKNGITIDFSYSINNAIIGSYQDILNKRDELAFVQKEVKELEKKYNDELAKKSMDDLSCFDQFIEGDSLIGTVNGYDSKILKQITDALLDKPGIGFVFIANINNGKIVFVAKSNNGVHCGNMVKTAAKICGGNGGGRPDFAQAGGKIVENVDNAIKEIKGLL